MLEKSDIETIRGLIRTETEAIIRQHLYGLTAGCLAPITAAIAELQESAKQLIDGQALIEKTMGGAFDDGGEPWRESLGD